MRHCYGLTIEEFSCPLPDGCLDQDQGNMSAWAAFNVRGERRAIRLQGRDLDTCSHMHGARRCLQGNESLLTQGIMMCLSAPEGLSLVALREARAIKAIG